MTAVEQNIQRQQEYIQTVIQYIMRQNGHVVLLSDDKKFTELLRTTLHATLNLPASSLTVLPNGTALITTIKNLCSRQINPLLFLERTIMGHDFSYFVQQCKDAFPETRIIMLTMDMQRERVMYLHEIGAHNVITKPISGKTLIEKMAFTLKPQSKIGELVDEARACLLHGQSVEASTLSQKILQIKPGSAIAYLIEGDACLLQGNYQGAQAAYEAASSSAELYLEPLRRLADLYGQMNNQEARLRYLQRLDSLSPLNVNRKIDIGEIHLSMGNDSSAEKLFQAALKQVDKEAMSTVGAVAIRIANLYAEKNPAAAEKFLRKGLSTKRHSLSIEDIATLNQLGIALRQQGRWQQALVEYDKALKIAPNDENLYYNMGMACAEGKEYQTARMHMLKSIEINSEFPASNPTIAYNIGIIFFYAGDEESAQEYMHLALQQDCDYALAQEFLSRL